MSDFLFRGNLAELDPDVYELTQLEAERQARKLILIPSESQAPLAVREAMASAFQNIYAEGYPDEETRTHDRGGDPRLSRPPGALTAATPTRATTRASSTPTLVEALARRRCAEAFAANGVKRRPDLRQRAGALRRPGQQRRLPRPGRARAIR